MLASAALTPDTSCGQFAISGDAVVVSTGKGTGSSILSYSLYDLSSRGSMYLAMGCPCAAPAIDGNGLLYTTRGQNILVVKVRAARLRTPGTQ